MERVLLVHVCQQRNRDLAKLEARKDTTRLEHTERLGNHAVNVRAVTNAKGNRVQVDRRALDRLAHQRRQNGLATRAGHGVLALRHGHNLVQRLGIAQLELDLGRVPVHALFDPLLPFHEHLGIDVEDRDVRLAIQVLGPGMVQQSKRDIARATRHIQAPNPATRIEHVHEAVLPQPMNTQRHGIVHQIVRGRYRRKHAADHALLLCLIDRLESKVRLALLHTDSTSAQHARPHRAPPASTRCTDQHGTGTRSA